MSVRVICLVFLLFGFVFKPNHACAQMQQLSFGAGGVQGIPDTVYFGDVINIEFWLVNTTPYPTTVDGLLEVNFATDSTAATTGSIGSLTNSLQSSFIPHSLYLPYQDSIKIDFTETIDNRFTIGDNITVVWPKVTNGLPTTSEFFIEKTYVVGFHSNIKESEEHYASVYPVPANDYLQIKTSNTNISRADISVYDIIGNKVFDVKNQLLSNRFFVSSLKAGVYFLQLEYINTKTKETEVIKFSKN